MKFAEWVVLKDDIVTRALKKGPNHNSHWNYIALCNVRSTLTTICVLVRLGKGFKALLMLKFRSLSSDNVVKLNENTQNIHKGGTVEKDD